MSKKKIIPYIIIAIIIVALCLLLYKMYNIYHDDKKIKKELETIKEEVIIKEDTKEEKEEESEEKGEVVEKLTFDFDKLKSINSDTVGWITVDSTNIDYPIVKSSNNSYYLNHSFYKEENINGWIFENSSNSSYFDDENTVLFGHNTNGVTMFSELKSIYNGNLGTNIDISIYLENTTYYYKVFSVYLENPNNTSNISEYTNKEIISDMKNKSKLNIDIEVTEDDKILTLSTCNNITEDRLILHAKKI